MKKLLSIFLGSLIFVGSCKTNVTKINSLGEIPLTTIEHKTDELVKQYLDMDIFSGVVLISKNGVTLYNKAFGLANRENNIANTLMIKFDIGSINKVFTKVLILQLIQEGKVNPEDNLRKFLAGFPETIAEKVTVKQLLSHTSGFGDYMQEPGFFERPKNEQSIKAIIEMIKKMPLHFEPGTDQEYSNAGYLLLGGIIESVTAKTYYENIKDRIINPLGLKNTVVDQSKETASNRATGYMKNMKGQLENNEGILMVPTPAGGFISTANDMAKFFEAYFYSDKLVSEASIKHDEFYPMIQDAKKNGRAIPIAGGFQGANSIVFNILRDTITIVVLANMDEPVAEQLGKGINDIIHGKDPEKPVLPAIQNVYKTYKEKGTEYLKLHFDELTINFHPGEPKDNILNNMGYQLLFANETEDAVNIFKLNTELFPKIANVWDSYGEALLKRGDKKASLAAYKKALAIRPELKSSKDAIKNMEEN